MYFSLCEVERHMTQIYIFQDFVPDSCLLLCFLDNWLLILFIPKRKFTKNDLRIVFFICFIVCFTLKIKYHS